MQDVAEETDDTVFGPPDCFVCHRGLTLDDGCEWPDGDTPILCWSCQHQAIEKMLKMLVRFGAHGEPLWDAENFRDGYKQVGSDHLVDCRNLLREYGVDPDIDAELLA